MDQGKDVVMVTSEPDIATFLGDTTRPPVFQRLFSKGVQIRTHLKVTRVDGGEAVTENVWSGQ